MRAIQEKIRKSGGSAVKVSALVSVALLSSLCATVQTLAEALPHRSKIRAHRGIVQSCETRGHPHASSRETLVRTRFLKRTKPTHSETLLRSKAARVTADQNCIVGSFEDSNTIKIMLIADGYTEGERLAALTHVSTVAEALSTTEPFRRYSRFLSICYKVLEAPSSGVSAVGAKLGCGGVSRALCVDPHVTSATASSRGVTPDVTAVLFNAEEYFGASQYWDGIFAISRTATIGNLGKPQYYWLAIHEFLHTCCTSPSTAKVRQYPNNQVSRYDYKIQDEYPTGSYQCSSSRSFNLAPTPSTAPWSYLKGRNAGYFPMHYDGRLCAYKPSETSIMATLASSLVNPPSQAGWIRQLFASLKTVRAISMKESKHEAGMLELTAVGADRLPFPVIDWFVNRQELRECTNRLKCSLRKASLHSGANAIRVSVGVADPTINPEELDALTDEARTTISVKGGGRVARLRETL